MSVFKFKTFEEAHRSLWNFFPDDEYFNKVHALFALAGALNKVKYPVGLFKYKTLKEAQDQKLEWEINKIKE